MNMEMEELFTPQSSLDIDIYTKPAGKDSKERHAALLQGESLEDGNHSLL